MSFVRFGFHTRRWRSPLGSAGVSTMAESILDFLSGKSSSSIRSSPFLYWLPALCGGCSLLVGRQVFYNFLFFNLYSFSRTGSWSWTSSYDFKFISMKVLMVWVAHLHRACRSSLVCLYPLLNLKMHLS